MSHFFYLAPEILLPFSPLTSKEFEMIRRKARELWQEETQWSASSVTTYSGSYRQKQLDEATCNRLAQRAGQQQFEYKQTPLLGSSASITLPGQAGSQEAADGKGGLPDIARHSPGTQLNVKHKVAHQIWGSESPCPTLPCHRTFRKCVKPPKPGLELLMNYRSRGKKLLKQLQGQWDYESKPISSEDSEADQYPEYRKVSVFD
uniref:RIKEN cDNA 1700011L22 gene n=2 Tax=Cricetulus griseus TaxID=10029 RepID=A0A8C2M846_CRIGR